MFPQKDVFPQIAVLVALLLVAPAAAQTSPQAKTQAVRMSMPAFGVQAVVEVRDLPNAEAETAVKAALQEIFEIDRLADIAEPAAAEPAAEATADENAQRPVPGGVRALNLGAGQGAQAVEPRVAEVLLRSLQFCIWSNGAYGPLGGEIYDLWGRHQESRPNSQAIYQAVGTAECNRLALNDVTTSSPGERATLAVGSRVDLRGIARGFAVDRGHEILREHGVENAWVSVGNVWRASGGGPDGRGWPVSLPPPPGEKEAIDHLWLQDQALVVLSIEPFGGEPFVPVIDQRSGVPAKGVVTVIVVTEQAVDAEPLAWSLFIFGHREGLMRLGTLEPRPAVFWLLGHGQGEPLEADYRWTTLQRVRRGR